MEKSLSLHKTYKGVLHPDSLLWCHGTPGLEHKKVRKFRYPFYKYSHTVDASVYRIIVCVCENCNMTFYGELAQGISLSIPVKFLGQHKPYEVQVKSNGKQLAIKGEIMTPFRQATQEEITLETREFIEHVQ